VTGRRLSREEHRELAGEILARLDARRTAEAAGDHPPEQLELEFSIPAEER
jgi:hypothetical protein